MAAALDQDVDVVLLSMCTSNVCMQYSYMYMSCAQPYIWGKPGEIVNEQKSSVIAVQIRHKATQHAWCLISGDRSTLSKTCCLLRPHVPLPLFHCPPCKAGLHSWMGPACGKQYNAELQLVAKLCASNITRLLACKHCCLVPTQTCSPTQVWTRGSPREQSTLAS